jgi:hypothetical protein
LASGRACQDKEILKMAVGDDVGFASSAPSSSSLAPSSSQPTRVQTPAEKKGVGLLAWASSQLTPWSSGEWTKIREASFTATLNKLSSAKTECSILQGDDSEVVASISKWATGLANGKLFMHAAEHVQQC